jgi:toxin ParE1/3/4
MSWRRLPAGLRSDAGTLAIARLQFHPGLGSPLPRHELGIANLRTWRVRGFPLVYVYIQRPDSIEVVRLLGERQDIGAIVSELG